MTDNGKNVKMARLGSARLGSARLAYDSSFFHTSYSGKKVLVLVPHQDDEINTAGNSIQNFIKAGADVYVMFANYGDFEIAADTRMNEAVNSLKVLGLERSHIFVLGYGDTLNGAESGHIFYTTDNTLKSTSGHTETYEAAGFQDLGFTLHGVHSTYCRKNYLRDMRELILQVKPDVIIATDFDWHADHRMLSLSFDEVMGEILSRPNNDYFPEVFRRFAYCTGWLSIPDLFDADFILSTVKPEPGVLNGYDRQIIDTSYYAWPERVRFPVPEGSKEPYASNILTKALRQHVSQGAYPHAANVINSDEVCWRRRTDSLSFSAKVEATSGNPDYVHDFKLLNVANVDVDAPDWENYLWIPDENDKVKELVFTWEVPQTISQIKLWGNIDGIPLESVLITMNSGYSSEVGPLPKKGLPMILDIPVQSGVRECRLKVLSQGSKDSGLAEVEFFAQSEQNGVVQPFIQITTGGNFVYEYPRKPYELSIPIECYSYRMTEPIKYEVEGSANFDGERLTFDESSNDDVALRAYTDSGVFCQSVFRLLNEKEIGSIRSRNAKEKRKICFSRNVNRVKHYSRMLIEKGPIFVIKTLTGKIIKKIKGKLK